MSARPLRGLITIVMNILVVLAVLLTAGLVVRFFGVLAATGWGDAVIKFAHLVTLPAGVDAIKTPYGGVFDVNAALSIVVLLAAEWLLAVVRGHA